MARFAVRPEVRDEAERTMHAIATDVRAKLPDAVWTTYRVGDQYVVLLVGSGSMFEERLQPFATAPITIDDCTLVTSSDLARRRR